MQHATGLGLARVRVRVRVSSLETNYVKKFFCSGQPGVFFFSLTLVNPNCSKYKIPIHFFDLVFFLGKIRVS